jgi:hypothetical protein
MDAAPLALRVINLPSDGPESVRSYQLSIFGAKQTATSVFPRISLALSGSLAECLAKSRRTQWERYADAKRFDH